MIGVGDDAISLLRADRAALAPDAPIVFNNVPPGDPSVTNLVNGTGIYSHMDILKLVELAGLMLPDAKHIVVVSGATGFDRRWEATGHSAQHIQAAGEVLSNQLSRRLAAFRPSCPAQGPAS
jgi:hypothetical protein